jgi:hypothetical protein
MEYVAGVIATDNQGNTIGEPNGLGGPNAFFACCTGGDTEGGNQSSTSDNSTNSNGTNGSNGNNGTSDNGSGGNGTTGGGVAGTGGTGGNGGTGGSSGTNGTSGNNGNGGNNGNSNQQNSVFTNPPGATAPVNQGNLVAVSPANKAHFNLRDKSRPSFSWKWQNQPQGISYYMLEVQNTYSKQDVKTKVLGLQSSWPDGLDFKEGNYTWTVTAYDNSGNAAASTGSNLFSIGNCVFDLHFTQFSAICDTGNRIKICMTFFYSSGNNTPLTFANSGSGLVATGMPGYTPNLAPSITGITVNANPVPSLTSQSIASGSTATICFDLGPTSSGQIDVGLQGDDINPSPSITCQPGIDTTISNPCLCNKCDSLKVDTTGAHYNIDPNTGSLNIGQPINVLGPDQLTGLTADIIYVDWQPDSAKCMPCDKDPKMWGVLTSATYAPPSGVIPAQSLTASEATWQLGSNANKGLVSFSITLPPVLQCCKLHGTVCIRYKFYLLPFTKSDCYECERVICYSF